MKERIFKNWISTVVGLILLISASIVLGFGLITLDTFIAFLPFVIGMIYARDTIFKRNSTKATMIILAVFFLSGCYTKKRCSELYPCQGFKVEQNDSTSITETTREKHDSTAYLVDSNLIRLYLACDSNNQVIILENQTLKESKNIKTTFTLQNNQLDVSNVIDSAAVYYSYYNTHFKQTITVRKKTSEQVIVEVNKLTGWQWFWVRTGQILSILFLLEIITIILIWKLKKKS
jgi:hypothetical protein